MLLPKHHIQLFVVVGNDRSWIETQTTQIAIQFPKSLVRRARILEYPEYLKSESAEVDIERLCLLRVLFVFRNFREECIESRKEGVFIVDGYVVDRGLVTRLISYLNLGCATDPINSVVAPLGFVCESPASCSRFLLPFCGVYHYKPLEPKIKELIASPSAPLEFDYLLILASRHACSLALYSRCSGEYYVVHSAGEKRRDGKSYEALEKEILAKQCGKDLVFALKEKERLENAGLCFVCSRVYSGARGILGKPRAMRVVVESIDIEFVGN